MYCISIESLKAISLMTGQVQKMFWKISGWPTNKTFLSWIQVVTIDDELKKKNQKIVIV